MNKLSDIKDLKTNKFLRAGDIVLLKKEQSICAVAELCYDTIQHKWFFHIHEKVASVTLTNDNIWYLNIEKIGTEDKGITTKQFENYKLSDTNSIYSFDMGKYLDDYLNYINTIKDNEKEQNSFLAIQRDAERQIEKLQKDIKKLDKIRAKLRL